MLLFYFVNSKSVSRPMWLSSCIKSFAEVWYIEMQSEFRYQVSITGSWVVPRSFLKHILLIAADWYTAFLFGEGSVKLIQQVKIAHSFFTVCVTFVPLYHLRFVFVFLHMAVKECFENHF